MYAYRCLDIAFKKSYSLRSGLGSITIVIVIDCNRLQLERSRNCNRNQIFSDSCVIVID